MSAQFGDSAPRRDHPASHRLGRILERLLCDEIMALLALVSVMASAAPLAFETSPRLHLALTCVDVLVLSAFMAEYLLWLASADSKLTFIRNPWRILDAFVIVTLTISLLPAAADALGVTPLLRLIRFARLAMLGTRSGARLSAREPQAADAALDAMPSRESFALQLGATPPLAPIGWNEVLARIGSEQADWLYVRGLAAEELADIARRLDVPEHLLGERLLEAAFPKLDRLQRFVTLFLWYPILGRETPPDGGDPPTRAALSRTGLLLVGAGQNVAVLARQPSDLLERLQQRLANVDASVPPLVSATHALVREVVRAWLRVVDDLEVRLARLEGSETHLGDPQFLQQTFRLRRDITEARTTLRHLARVTDELRGRPLAIQGFETVERPLFALLASGVSSVAVPEELAPIIVTAPDERTGDVAIGDHARARRDPVGQPLGADRHAPQRVFVPDEQGHAHPRGADHAGADPVSGWRHAGYEPAGQSVAAAPAAGGILGGRRHDPERVSFRHQGLVALRAPAVSAAGQPPGTTPPPRPDERPAGFAPRPRRPNRAGSIDSA